MTLWYGGGELSQEQPANKPEVTNPIRGSLILALLINLNVRLPGERTMGSEPEPAKSYRVCFQ
jgi:hypothetical protein